MEFAEWMAIAGLVTTLLGSFGGAWLGARLSRGTALDLAEQERKFAERQAVRTRQDQVASEFDERLHAAMADMPRGVVTVAGREDASNRLWATRNRMRTAWQQTTILEDPDLLNRFRALDTAVFIGAQDVDSLSIADEDGSVNLYPIDVATRDLRRALAAFQRREPIPDAEGPDSATLVELRSLNAVCEWLIERGVS